MSEVLRHEAPEAPKRWTDILVRIGKTAADIANAVKVALLPDPAAAALLSDKDFVEGFTKRYQEMLQEGREFAETDPDSGLGDVFYVNGCIFPHECFSLAYDEYRQEYPEMMRLTEKGQRDLRIGLMEASGTVSMY